MSKEKKTIVMYSFSGLILLTLMIFSGIRMNDKKIEDLEVSIEEENGNFFTDQLEVIDLLTLEKADYLIGAEMQEIEPKELERRVEQNPFVKEAEVYWDLKGNMKVKVTQRTPIARVFTNGKKDHYIDTEGNVLPVNAKHTARVPLVETSFPFSWEENLNETPFGMKLFSLLKYIEQDEFWQAQIAHVLVDKKGDVVFKPQVTKQEIEFGSPDDLDKKFKKLMIFYKEILPKKGWNLYSKVNLRFGNQIICE